MWPILNGGMVMRAWYDIRIEGDARMPDAADLRQSEAQVRALIRREQERGVPAGRIVLAGFSQGGAVTLHTGLRYPERLAGLIALSCSLPLAETVAAETAPVGRGMAVFPAHERHDEMAPPARGRQARDALSELGYAVTWREYPIPHSVSAEEIRDISSWLQVALPPTA